eukprot:Sdes_comp20441_c0_seq1m14612
MNQKRKKSPAKSKDAQQENIHAGLQTEENSLISCNFSTQSPQNSSLAQNLLPDPFSSFPINYPLLNTTAGSSSLLLPTPHNGGKIPIPAAPKTDLNLQHSIKVMEKAKKIALQQEKRRQSRVALEQKRRNHINHLFDQLENTLNTLSTPSSSCSLLQVGPALNSSSTNQNSLAILPQSFPDSSHHNPRDASSNLSQSRKPALLVNAIESIESLQSNLENAMKCIEILKQRNFEYQQEKQKIDQLKIMIFGSANSPPIQNIRLQVEMFAHTQTTLSYYKENSLKLYGFRFSGEYFRYDLNRDEVDIGYPRPINDEHWRGLAFREAINCAVNWGNGKAYFFSGDSYLSYDLASESADAGYPQQINSNNLPGLSLQRVDAALNWGNGKIYLFHETNYVRFDVNLNRQDPDYPKVINASTWPGLLHERITNILKWNESRAYIFQGSRWVAYNLSLHNLAQDPCTAHLEETGLVDPPAPFLAGFSSFSRP